MIAALMRRLMSFDTSVTSALGYSRCSATVLARMALSAPWPGSVSGNPAASWRVWKNSRPRGGFLPPFGPFAVGSSRPRSICCLLAPAISSSRKRLTWRTLRAASDRPFLPASSSSSTVIGMKMSCSSNRKIAVGSCISTLVSRTNMRRWAVGFFDGKGGLRGGQGAEASGRSIRAVRRAPGRASRARVRGRGRRRALRRRDRLP